jgi:hypothetical protein
VPLLRRLAFWLVDLAVVVVVVACVLHFCRRRSVACSWEGMRASCRVETEDSLGRVERHTIAGVRGAAYLDGLYVGLVTDARNKDDLALFGTSEIEVANVADARRLRAFADDHEPDHIAISSGVAHPRWVTAGLLASLLVYGFVSRRARRSLARHEK